MIYIKFLVVTSEHKHLVNSQVKCSYQNMQFTNKNVVIKTCNSSNKNVVIKICNSQVKMQLKKYAIHK